MESIISSVISSLSPTALPMVIENVFEYNQHFVAMMNIINAARLNPPKEGHKHHIIPRCWFKMNNLPVDNSKDNLVLLSYEDHVKVHKLAYLCAMTSKFKGKMAYAYLRLTQGEIVANGAFVGEQNSRYGRPLDKEHSRKISEAHKGKHLSKEHIENVSAALKGKVPWNKGNRLSEEHRSNLSKAHKGKNNTWLKGKTWKLVDGKRIWAPKEVK